MNSYSAFRVLPVAFLVLLALPASAQTWELVWADEFDGTAVDQARWSFQIGDGCDINLCGWGNNELEWYLAENATVADGFLTITAKQEQVGGKNYTSTRMRTINKGDWTYGRVETRAQMPVGKGLWPAIWMLPTTETYGGWAASGEIDIMEYVGDKSAEVLGTLHYGAPWPNNQFSSNTFTLQEGTFNDDFHVFALEWEPGEIRWYVDDVLYATQNNWSTTGGTFPAPFDQDFHLLMNVAVGGNLPGNPDASTVFPQTMVVDYVRVFREVSQGEGPQGDLLFDDMEHGDPHANAWFQFNGSVGGGGINANIPTCRPVTVAPSR